MDEVETLFHEFGHALHGLLSQCTYPSQAGTKRFTRLLWNCSSDHGKLVLRTLRYETYAKHYTTGEVMPQELMDVKFRKQALSIRIHNDRTLSASLLDMDYHSIKDTANFDVEAFEKATMERIGMIPEIIVRYRSTFFNHRC